MKGIGGENVPSFQAAFDIHTLDDLEYQKEVISTGLDLFEQIYGFRTKFFVPTNGYFNNTLEKDLFNSGIKYIDTAKRQEKWESPFRLL